MTVYPGEGTYPGPDLLPAESNPVVVAQPILSSASIRLSIDAHGETITSIVRTDRNGVFPVRTLAGLLPTNQTLVVTDYEPAFSGQVIYTVVTNAGEYQTATVLNAPRPWLFVPVMPQYSVEVPLVTGYEALRASLGTVHRVVGRPDPLVTIGRLGRRTGTLDVWCADHAAAISVADVYSQGQVVMLRQPTHEGMDLYHVAEDVQVRPIQVDGHRTRWTVQVRFVEVQRPSAPLAGALGWTFDDVATDYASFNVLPQVFETFDDLTMGPEA